MPRRAPPTNEDLLRWLMGENLVDGLHAVAHFRALAIERERHFATKARRAGLPWYWIAFWLGTSAQAVHKRWASKIEPNA